MTGLNEAGEGEAAVTAISSSTWRLRKKRTRSLSGKAEHVVRAA